MSEVVIKIEDLHKKYRLGAIGGGTLTADLQSWWAKVRGKEDPNTKIGAKTYGKNETFMALNGVNLEVRKGEALGIIGGNGAGKSTTLKILSRVTAPTKGSVKIKGRISSLLEVGTGFHPELTGRENIYLNGAILGMSKEEVDSKIEDIIEFSECRQFIDTPVKRYSSGMFVKLAFSVAAHLDSEILIMDEVLAVGDMKFQQKCLNKMSELVLQEGRTILYVSHNMNTIRQLCERCVVLNKGKVIYDGDVEEAIQIYLNQSNTESSVFTDLSSRERPGNSTNVVRMKSIRLLNKEDCIFSVGENMHLELKWRSLKNLEDIRFRMIIRYRDDSAVGLTVSPSFTHCKKGEDIVTKFKFDVSNLAQGKYFASIALYQSDKVGNSVILDHVTRAFSFDVINNKDDKQMLNWEHRWWGSVRFPELEICE